MQSNDLRSKNEGARRVSYIFRLVHGSTLGFEFTCDLRSVKQCIHCLTSFVNTERLTIHLAKEEVSLGMFDTVLVFCKTIGRQSIEMKSLD
jgi:hypothetical protein